MIRRIILKLSGMLEKMTGKRVLFIESNIVQGNRTAVLSEYGFWYAGNIFNMADIAYGIAINGSVEKNETILVKKILGLISSKKDSVSFYDIGANSGYYGILSAFLYKEKTQVYSFEPLAEYADCIKKSVYLNRLDNLTIFEFGIGNKDEEKTMYLAGTGSTVENGFSGGNVTGERKISIKKIDGIVQSKAIALPDFIKIDVEGHEFKVLQGAENSIRKNKPVLFIEIAHSLEAIGRHYINKDYQKTFEFLGQIGYRSYRLQDGKLCEFDYNGIAKHIDMYLFLHTSGHAQLKDILLK